MPEIRSAEIKFEGEEANSGFASPSLDMIATIFLLVLSLAIMAASVALPMPGDILTAPGLLPFIVAATLLLMAMGLGYSAIMRRRAGINTPALAERDLPTDINSLLLAGAVGLYIAALQVLSFQLRTELFGVDFRFSAFEPVTIIILAAIMHVSWRGPFWISALVSTGWTLTLSLVFQKVFKLPLPGTF
ncbi:MAG: tripartite tricarboxylate transporter TctB family protein [Stappiaceae bacterium]